MAPDWRRPKWNPPDRKRAVAKTLCLVTGVALFACWADVAAAQSSYPEKSIRMLFGFPAGSDSVARLLADKLGAALGKPVIVENVTGAAGNIAADRTAKASPDGYTIGMLANSNVAINVSLYKRLPFDPVKDLIPVTQIYGYPNILVVNNQVAKNVKELIALARAAPGKLSYGHSGLGTTQHISGELMKARARVDIQELAYRGPPQILTDLLAGQIAMSFQTPGVTLSLIQQEKIRAIAVTSSKRVPFAPDVPTMDESGFPGFQTAAWFGLFLPAGTPAAIVETLHRETTRIVTQSDMRARIYEFGDVPLNNTPAEFAEVIKAETLRWVRVIQEAGVKQID
jgi:tripartite-type tricarboxylate transporter receptor subunit TctC